MFSLILQTLIVSISLHYSGVISEISLKNRGISIYFVVLILKISALALNASSAFAYSSSPSDLNSTQNDSLPVIVNHDMIRMFEDFKERGTITETVFSRIVTDSQRNNSERWRQLLEEYYSALSAGEDPMHQETFIELAKEEVNDFLVGETHELEENQESSEPSIIAAHDAGSVETLRYHIQIAASLTPIQEKELSRIYNGEKQISHFVHSGWNKYHIGYYNTFKQSKQALRNINVKGAFIIAFLEDTLLIAYKARQLEKNSNPIQLHTFDQDEQAQFRVQVAASKTQLTQPELRKLLKGATEIGVIYENEWYKYSIPASASLADSWKMARASGIEGAFVVRYQKGIKLPLR